MQAVVRFRRAGSRALACASRHILALAGLVIIIAAAPSARGQNAYISASGSFTGSNQFEDFSFAPTETANALSLRTWAWAGGINAGAYGVAPGGIDSTLNLFNAANAS